MKKSAAFNPIKGPTHAKGAHRATLVRWLSELILEGCIAGLTCGCAILLVLGDFRQLLADQPQASLALSLYLIVCSQIGAVTSLVVGLMFQSFDVDDLDA